jgi:predicted permease
MITLTSSICVFVASLFFLFICFSIGESGEYRGGVASPALVIISAAVMFENIGFLILTPSQVEEYYELKQAEETSSKVIVDLPVTIGTK